MLSFYAIGESDLSGLNINILCLTVELVKLPNETNNCERGYLMIDNQLCGYTVSLLASSTIQEHFMHILSVKHIVDLPSISKSSVITHPDS